MPNFGIGIGAVTFSAETEIALFAFFLGSKQKRRERAKVCTCNYVKKNSTKPYFTSVCNRALHP